MQWSIDDVVEIFRPNDYCLANSLMLNLIKGKTIEDLVQGRIKEFIIKKTLSYDGEWYRIIYNNINICLSSVSSRNILDCLRTLIIKYLELDYPYIELSSIYCNFDKAEMEQFAKTKLFQSLESLDVLIFTGTSDIKYCTIPYGETDAGSALIVTCSTRTILKYKIYKYTGELNFIGDNIKDAFIELVKGYISGIPSSKGLCAGISHKYFKTLRDNSIVYIGKTCGFKLGDYLYWLKQGKEPRYLSMANNYSLKVYMPDIIFLRIEMTAPHAFTTALKTNADKLPNLQLFISEMDEDEFLGVKNDPNSEKYFYDLTFTRFNKTKRAIQ
jgi:hypothetical protein